MYCTVVAELDLKDRGAIADEPLATTKIDLFFLQTAWRRSEKQGIINKKKAHTYYICTCTIYICHICHYIERVGYMRSRIKMGSGSARGAVSTVPSVAFPGFCKTGKA